MLTSIAVFNAHGYSHVGSSFLSDKLSFAEFAVRLKKNLDKCQVVRTGTSLKSFSFI